MLEVAQAARKYALALCRVQGFPTIKAFVNGRMIDYNGDRSAGHLKDWAISLIPQKVCHLFFSSRAPVFCVTAH